MAHHAQKNIIRRFSMDLRPLQGLAVSSHLLVILLLLPSRSFSGAPSQPEGFCPHCSGPVPPGLDLGAPLEALSGNASPTREASGPVGGGGASAESGVWGYPPGGDQDRAPRGQLVYQAVRPASQRHPSGDMRHRRFPLPSRFLCGRTSSFIHSHAQGHLCRLRVWGIIISKAATNTGVQI